jgi:hypothetical protein
MRTTQSPMRSPVCPDGGQLWPSFGALIIPPRIRRPALASLVAVLMMSGCSQDSPTRPSHAAVNSGGLLERRIGDVGSGGGSEQCPEGETCGPVTVELTAPDSSTFMFECGLFIFSRQLPQTAICDSLNPSTGTGRFSKWNLAEDPSRHPSNTVTVRSSSVDLRFAFEVGGRGYRSEGTLEIQDFFRNVPCVPGEPALRLQATGHLPQLGRVTATISGNCEAVVPF